MISQMSHVMTLANSIIGVSVLAMPFCFKQCGIVLATLVLLVCSVLSRLACHFLIKSAVMSRRRNFELLAFHAFGHMGKFLVELFIIGFLVGTCIAFFVVVGDLGPQIIGNVIDKQPEDIRTSILIATSVFIVLPLGLLRNIDSLSSICTATIGFYLCLVLKVMAESMQHIFAGDWYEHVDYWRPSGILQCLPIFSMALFCQTQLFEIYDTIPNVSLEKMNEVVRGALNICTIVYLCVGFFGYIAFCTQPFTGNILMSLEPSLSSEMIKMGFVFSVAFSFPLVIFPCRASLNSLLFRRVYTHEPSTNYLPEARFRCLTIAIVTVSLITGILIPNIEFVLGLVGSTIGVMICLIFPAVFFISISTKHTNERLSAQAILFVGVWIMILGTYANLYAMEESTNNKPFVTTNKPLSQINNLPLHLNKDDSSILANVPKNPDLLLNVNARINRLNSGYNPDSNLDVKAKDVRQEPPIPVERVVVTEKIPPASQKSEDALVATFAPRIKEIVEQIKTLNDNAGKIINEVNKQSKVNQLESSTLKVEQKIELAKQKEKPVDMQKSDNLINSDALKKEDSELAADADADNIIAAERREELWKTLEKHKLEQLQMMREQKEILKDIKEQKKEIERDKLKIAKVIDVTEKIEHKPVLPEKKIDDNDNSLTKHKNVKVSENLKEEVAEKKNNTHSKSLNVVVPVKNEQNAVIEKNEINLKNDAVITSSDKLRNDNNLLNDAVVKNRDSQATKTKTGNEPEELLKGPIINALTKRTLQKAVTSGDIVSNKDDDTISKKDQKPVYKREEKGRNDVENVPSNVDPKNSKIKLQEFSLPIALKLRNQSKTDHFQQQSTNITEEDVKMIGRDILENHDREKREVAAEDIEKVNTVMIDSKAIEEETSEEKNAREVYPQECSKVQQDIDKEETLKSNKSGELTVLKTYTTETSLIKTNIYLADQVIPNAIPVDPNIDIRGEFVKVKQRDLKAVDSS